MNYIGALLLVAAGLAAGIMKSRALTESDKTYSAVIHALCIIKSEISSRSAPLDGIICSIQSTAPRQIRRFIEHLNSGFSELDERTFCDVWTSGAEEYLQGISPQGMAAISEVGASLGKYDADMQRAAIERCITQLTAERDRKRMQMSANKRMYIGLGGAGGLILAIVLI